MCPGSWVAVGEGSGDVQRRGGGQSDHCILHVLPFFWKAALLHCPETWVPPLKEGCLGLGSLVAEAPHTVLWGLLASGFP